MNVNITIPNKTDNKKQYHGKPRRSPNNKTECSYSSYTDILIAKTINFVQRDLIEHRTDLLKQKN